MSFDPNSAKKTAKNPNEVLLKKKDLPSRKRWRCSTKKCWMICFLTKKNLQKQNGLNLFVTLSNYIYVKI
jgi:hypothetical protein